MKHILIIIIVFISGIIIGKYLIDDNTDKIWSGADGISYYKVEHISDFSFDKIYEFILRVFSPGDDTSFMTNQLQGLMFCQMVDEKSNILPTMIGLGYAKLGSSIWYEGEKITTCEDCIINNNIPHMLYDGQNTFYKGIMLTGFNYDNFTVLSDTDSVFTDKNNVYYQGILLKNMDWNTFEQPNRSLSVYKDKNYTYTVLPGQIIERTYNNSGNIESI